MTFRVVSALRESHFALAQLSREWKFQKFTFAELAQNEIPRLLLERINEGFRMFLKGPGGGGGGKILKKI